MVSNITCFRSTGKEERCVCDNSRNDASDLIILTCYVVFVQSFGLLKEDSFIYSNFLVDFHVSFNL